MVATPRKDIEEVILELSQTWLGKHDVVAIADEYEEDSPFIAFYVNREDIKKEEYPTEAEGYAIVVRPSGPYVFF
ncbi:MAG: hypothetical protein Q8R53_01265 [Nanoarchaeota archaeon]|nr:hypothetical protein [Nanoarchaeota archaeon]